MENIEFKIQKCTSRSEMSSILQQYSESVVIEEDDYSDEYYLISTQNDDAFSVGVCCYEDGLSPKVIYFNHNRSMAVGFNKRLVVINLDNKVIRTKRTLTFTIYDILEVKDTILVLHEFGVIMLKEDLSEIMSHNRLVMLEDYSYVDNELKLKFEGESEYLLNLFTGEIVTS